MVFLSGATPSPKVERGDCLAGGLDLSMARQARRPTSLRLKAKPRFGAQTLTSRAHGFGLFIWGWEQVMTSASRGLILLFVLTVFAGATWAAPQDAPPGTVGELATARDLLHQALRVIDEQYRKEPNGGVLFPDDLAADLAEVGDHDAAESTIRHLDFSNVRFATALRSVATGYARAGDMLRVRRSIARIGDLGSIGYIHKAWAWRDAG